MEWHIIISIVIIIITIIITINNIIIFFIIIIINIIKIIDLSSSDGRFNVFELDLTNLISSCS